jgi:hypothetical protein
MTITQKIESGTNPLHTLRLGKFPSSFAAEEDAAKDAFRLTPATVLGFLFCW